MRHVPPIAFAVLLAAGAVVSADWALTAALLGSFGRAAFWGALMLGQGWGTAYVLLDHARRESLRPRKGEIGHV